MINFLILALAGSACLADANLEHILRAKDQALLDAFAPGDRATWDAALAPDAMYLDENNVLMTRSAFLNQLKPLPANTSGHIEIVQYDMARSGDVAIVVHKDAETEFYHGQTLYTTFFMSETWHKTPKGWRLLLLHTSDLLKDPPSIQLPMQNLLEYVGTYQAGPDLSYVIAIKDGALIGGREARPAVSLLTELKDVLFISGQPRTRKIFRRDEHGIITDFVDRREGEDLVWKKQSKNSG